MPPKFRLKLDLFTDSIVSDNIENIEFEVTVNNEKEFFDKVRKIMEMFIKV